MDFKSRCRNPSSHWPPASYVLVKEVGPEHSKTFTVEARLHSAGGHGKVEFTGRAEGSTKKKAEQDAARQVLEYLATPAAAENKIADKSVPTERPSP
jgi:dsRNA-specific ribonuclease